MGAGFTVGGGGAITGAVNTVNINPMELFEPTWTMTGPVTAPAGTATNMDKLLAAST